MAGTAQETPCAFDDRVASFAGSPLKQATCLLRPVRRYAHLGEAVDRLPPPLDTLIGRPMGVDAASVESYLRRRGVDEEDIGGTLSQPLSRGNDNDSTAEEATYFVIHDTSWPYYGDRRFAGGRPFPGDINEPSWEWNDLAERWVDTDVAHVFVNRLGASSTRHDFGVPWRATKREMQTGVGAKGRFLHVELIQPRSRDPNGGPGNDAIAPEPGFTAAQLRRLALLYVAASLRRGKWLIPAYHAAVDAGIVGAHDDPQNFDLGAWAGQLSSVLRAIHPPPR